MSELTRREVLKMTATAAAVGVAALGGASSADAGLLEGDFWVYCQKCGKADKVSGITVNHNCSKDGTQTVNSGEAVVECEKGHHPPGNKVSDVTRQHKCEEKIGDGVCGRPCRDCPAPPNANS
jgi:hypothetical protein